MSPPPPPLPHAQLGDVMVCDVRIPDPQTLRMVLETQDAVDHANLVLSIHPTAWRLEQKLR